MAYQRPKVRRVCKDCPDVAMVSPRRDGGVPERCMACSRAFFGGRPEIPLRYRRKPKPPRRHS